jgi:HK97 family phage prohead protease
MLQKNFKLEVKSVEDDGTFTGYASVTGNVDSDNEVIDKGAFKRTLDHTKGVVPILWQHDRTQPVGWNMEATEDGVGLSVKGRLMVDTEIGRMAQSFLKTGLEVGAKPGLSIGFTVPRDGAYHKEGIRHFKEVALKEYSIATFQANGDAFVTGAKEESMDDQEQEKAGRAISAATADKIKQAMAHISAGTAILQGVYLANDTNLPNPVGGGKSEEEKRKRLATALAFGVGPLGS